MDRVLNQLQLAETMCVLKRRLVLAPYLFPSLRFSRELRRQFQQDTESMILQQCFLEIVLVAMP